MNDVIEQATKTGFDEEALSALPPTVPFVESIRKQAFQEFLAEEATAELRTAGIEGEIIPETFEITDLRFTTVDETELAAAMAFATTGGPEVLVFGYKDPGDLALPSWLFLAGSIIGFVVHLPFLDRAERSRKEILTGGEQPPWRGPT